MKIAVNIQDQCYADIFLPCFQKAVTKRAPNGSSFLDAERCYVSAVAGNLLTKVDARTLRPILNEAEGFYQIGPRDKCTEHFVLSVTIAFATNLPQVILDLWLW